MCGFVYLYNIDISYIESYGCMNVSERAMPWNIGSLGMMWLGKTQAKAGGQAALAAVPRLLREAAVWDWAGRSPAARSSQGQGWDALITGYGIHRRKWLKAWEGMRWGNPEDLMDLVGDSHNSDSWQKSQHFIHCSLLTNRVTRSPTVGLNIHWNWLKNELGKSPSAQNVHMRQDKKLSATHSQPEDTGSTAQHLQPGAEDGLH